MEEFEKFVRPHVEAAFYQKSVADQKNSLVHRIDSLLDSLFSVFSDVCKRLTSAAASQVESLQREVELLTSNYMSERSKNMDLVSKLQAAKYEHLEETKEYAARVGVLNKELSSLKRDLSSFDQEAKREDLAHLKRSAETDAIKILDGSKHRDTNLDRRSIVRKNQPPGRPANPSPYNQAEPRDSHARNRSRYAKRPSESEEEFETRPAIQAESVDKQDKLDQEHHRADPKELISPLKLEKLRSPTNGRPDLIRAGVRPALRGEKNLSVPKSRGRKNQSNERGKSYEVTSSSIHEDVPQEPGVGSGALEPQPSKAASFHKEENKFRNLKALLKGSSLLDEDSSHVEDSHIKHQFPSLYERKILKVPGDLDYRRFGYGY